MERSASLGNVFRIFLRDIKRLAKVPPAWLVVIFLMVLPSLYSWLNIIGFWNPYDNTSNLRVCMVNEDAGAYDENLGQLNMGDQIADQLRDNDQLDWAFVDREEAMREVSAGEAYAAFVVPEDFSADVATLASGDFQQPQLLYYVNEKTGPVAPKITDTGANTLDTTINETFFSTVSGAVADALDDFLAASGTKLDAARSGAAGRVGNARADIAGNYRALIGKSADSLQKLLHQFVKINCHFILPPMYFFIPHCRVFPALYYKAYPWDHAFLRFC